MPLRITDATTTTVTIEGYGTIDLDVLPGNGWNKSRLGKAKDLLQSVLDVRIPLDDPSLVDDPDALVDPERPDFFHDSGDLVSRSVIVVDVSMMNGNLRLSLRRAR